MNKLFLILLLAVPSMAQTDLTDLKNLIGPDSHDAPQVSYDKFKDKTFVTAGFLPLDNQSVQKLEMFASFDYPGMQLRNPATLFVVSFAVENNEWVWLKGSHELHLLVDGKHDSFPAVNYDGEMIKSGTRETVNYVFSSIELRTIATASKAEIQIGPIETEIDHRTKLSLKDLLDAAKIK